MFRDVSSKHTSREYELNTGLASARGHAALSVRRAEQQGSWGRGGSGSSLGSTEFGVYQAPSLCLQLGKAKRETRVGTGTDNHSSSESKKNRVSKLDT